MAWLWDHRASTRHSLEGPDSGAYLGEQDRRHTTATHLLHAGWTINTIRGVARPRFIEHDQRLCEIDLETKARALALCEVRQGKRAKPWHHDKGLMAFLRAL